MRRQLLKKCTGPCGRSLPLDRFATNDRLYHDRLPWCDECLAKLATGPAMRKRYRQDYLRMYMRRYMKARRVTHPARERWAVMLEDGHPVVVTLLRATGTIRAHSDIERKDRISALLIRLGVGAVVSRTVRAKEPTKLILSGKADLPQARALLIALRAEGRAEREPWKKEKRRSR